MGEKEEAKKIGAKLKLCRKCNVSKPLAHFYARKKGLTSPCKRCEYEYRKQYRKNHPEKQIEEGKRRWRFKKEQMKGYNQQFRDTHPGYYEEYRKNNKQRGADGTRRYRARKRGVFSIPYSRRQIFDRDGGICWVCKKLVDFDKWDLDHIMPIVVGGADIPDNVAVAHPSCNRRRNRFV